LLGERTGRFWVAYRDKLPFLYSFGPTSIGQDL
jgi:hypothetical protein